MVFNAPDKVLTHSIKEGKKMNVSAINSAQTPALKTQQKAKTNSQPVQFTKNICPSKGSCLFRRIKSATPTPAPEPVPAPIPPPPGPQAPPPPWLEELGRRR